MQSVNELPLVSVVIATYNSSLTIIEALDSVRKQSYKNIEIVITDDCSQDDTIEICRKWLNKHSCELSGSEIVTSNVNTGLCANSNRGIRAAHGEWIKCLAGDDLLMPDCISKCVEAAAIRHFRIASVKLKLFGGDVNNYPKSYKHLENMYEILASHDLKIQYHTALYRHILPSTTTFFQKSLWSEVGGLDEKFKNLDERPFEINVLERTAIYLIDEQLYLWRQRENSLTHKVSEEEILFFHSVLKQKLKKEGMLLHWWDLWLMYNIKKRGGKLYYKILRLLSPLYYWHKILWLFS